MKTYLLYGLRIITTMFLIDFLFGPLTNPIPMETVKIHGKFPFDAGYEIMFSQGASSRNYLAGILCGGFGFITGGPLSCKGGNIMINTKKIDCCNYEAVVFLDQYFYGFLGWETERIWLRILPAGYNKLWGGEDVPRYSSNIKCVDSYKENIRSRLVMCHEVKIDGLKITKEYPKDIEINFTIDKIN